MTTTTHKQLPTYVSLARAAQITDQSVRTIRRRISDGTIPAYRFGPRQIRINSTTSKPPPTGSPTHAGDGRRPTLQAGQSRPPGRPVCEPDAPAGLPWPR